MNGTPTQRKVALITGITGMDGSHMADLLLSKGYEVHGIIRRSSNFNTGRVDHIRERLNLHYGDLTDAGNIFSIIKDLQPNEVYNFAAQSHVKVSCELENYTFQTNTMGLLNILQAVKSLGLSSRTKIYQASTSEMYGNTTDGSVLLTEDSLLAPVSPYGVSKLAAHYLANYYRDGHGMFVVSSILLNHESERRAPTFVTQKIAQHVSRYAKLLKNGSAACKVLKLGNLAAKRDWGYAVDYVNGIWLMMQHSIPDTYVLATGEEHSVREFVNLAFAEIGITIEWKGKDGNEKGFNPQSGEILVEVDPQYYRPIDIEHLVGDSSKAKKTLGWTPSVNFPELVKKMVNYKPTNLLM